jgi:hypothetical protein
VTENVVDSLQFLSGIRCDIFAGRKFIASPLYDFLFCPDALNALPFSLVCEIICRASLRTDSQDGLYDFISKGAEMNREMFRFLEFLGLPECSTDGMNDFIDLLSEHFYEISASRRAVLRLRLVLPNGTGSTFPCW